jgi:hypothetical protein
MELCRATRRRPGPELLHARDELLEAQVLAQRIDMTPDLLPIRELVEISFALSNYRQKKAGRKIRPAEDLA